MIADLLLPIDGDRKIRWAQAKEKLEALTSKVNEARISQRFVPPAAPSVLPVTLLRYVLVDLMRKPLQLPVRVVWAGGHL